jgi:hypothetical protein
MSGHESPLFRATAAWVMGETGDVRFSDTVRRLLLQPEPLIRKRALAALGQIKQANSAAAGAPQLHISARTVAGSKIQGLRRVMAAVAAYDAAEQRKIAPVQFILSEDSRYVISYKVNEKPLADAVTVVFVIPCTTEADFQPFVEGALSCLRWKRPTDRWSVLPYLENEETGLSGEPRDMHPLQFAASTEALEASFREPAKRHECTDLWTALFRTTRSEGLSSRGRRHVIVLSRAPENRAAGPGVVANVQNGRIGVQAIASVKNPELEALCRRTQSRYTQGTGAELPELIRHAYLSILARYEITYQPVAADATALKLRVQSPDGWGETTIPILIAE